MREETRKIYTFDELREEAQRKALDEFEPCYGWSEENRKSLEAFADTFGIRVKSWDIDRGDISWSFKGEPWEERSGIRLYSWLMYHFFDILYPMAYQGEKKRKRTWRRIPGNSGACVFTGYCFDDILLNPIMEFLKKPSERVTWESLVNDCLYAWVFAFRKEIEYTYTDESKKEDIEANGYEFTEDGGRI